MALQTWGDAILDAWDRVVDRFINYIPNLFGAIIILILGWILAMLLEKLIDEIIRSLGLQKLFEMVRIEAAVKKTGVKKDTTALIAALVRPLATASRYLPRRINVMMSAAVSK